LGEKGFNEIVCCLEAAFYQNAGGIVNLTGAKIIFTDTMWRPQAAYDQGDIQDWQDTRLNPLYHPRWFLLL
jgi:hypothetical protein